MVASAGCRRRLLLATDLMLLTHWVILAVCLLVVVGLVLLVRRR